MESQTCLSDLQGLVPNLRARLRKLFACKKHKEMTVYQEVNQVWSMNYKQDQLEDGRTFGSFNVTLDFERQTVGKVVYFSLHTERVIREIKQIISCLVKSKVICCDKGPDYIGAAIEGWAKYWGIKPEYTQQTNLQQNDYMERLNEKVRYEWLLQCCWADSKDVQDYAIKQIWSYNHNRPKTAFG